MSAELSPAVGDAVAIVGSVVGVGVWVIVRAVVKRKAARA